MTSVRTGNARLLRLAELLRGLPRKRFNYRYWVGADWEGDPNLSCGTAACALGWATTMPSLRRVGLRLINHPEFGARIRLKGHSGGAFSAASAVFALEEDAALYLFSPGPAMDYTATPKQVAKKIEKFVAARA